ncbi:chromosomal replication initiator protein DnaA [Acuticoccus sediminis]|uniref:Chromosomal replication initiator protein DnaA n=1 Tax=Acuticoccus sediminis TaxID=2184697 RepID=A0A8B2NSV6_9HYPH|nr:DnaA/Hda family protein [Acuticoccus sediminis]RAI01129.1 chromosomal replication initiator protein DnaA [Acuticoccus sediminis]
MEKKMQGYSLAGTPEARAAYFRRVSEKGDMRPAPRVVEVATADPEAKHERWPEPRSREDAHAAHMRRVASNCAREIDTAARPALVQQQDVPPAAKPVKDTGDQTPMGWTPLNPSMTFETFVASSDLPLALARKVAATERWSRVEHSPIVIYGGDGLGKTHLLQAIAATSPQQCLYVTAEDFMYRLVGTLTKGQGEAMRKTLAQAEVLLVDGIDRITGSMFVPHFEQAIDLFASGGQQVVCTSRVVPAVLEMLGPETRRRLSSGMVAEMAPPNYGQRKDIVAKRIEIHRTDFAALAFPDEVAEFIAKSITTNGRDLVGAVSRIVAHSELAGRTIDLQMAELAILDLLRANTVKTPKIEDIQRVVCQHYGISRGDLVSARRTKVIVRPRQVAMYLCKMLTPRSLPEIGRRFGNRDHTTVLHAVRKIDDLKERDQKLAEDIEIITRGLA